MSNFTRRQALAVSGGLIASMIVPVRGAVAAVGDTLTIAFNVNLPSFDPTVVLTVLAFSIALAIAVYLDATSPAPTPDDLAMIIVFP